MEAELTLIGGEVGTWGRDEGAPVVDGGGGPLGCPRRRHLAQGARPAVVGDCRGGDELEEGEPGGAPAAADSPEATTRPGTHVGWFSVTLPGRKAQSCCLLSERPIYYQEDGLLLLYGPLSQFSPTTEIFLVY